MNVITAENAWGEVDPIAVAAGLLVFRDRDDGEISGVPLGRIMRIVFDSQDEVLQLIDSYWQVKGKES